jgi:hypothetical protein
MMYVLANVKVKYGQLPVFNEAMTTVKRVMEANGWKLLGAWSTVIGDIFEVHDLWEVENADAVAGALAAAYQEPDFVEAAVRLSAVCDRETLTLMAKTPYSP